ncbi:helix-turn-helix transcriptional regulator [Gordonia sp. MP11Mi]|uniref:Helix-turn-helix domain-containing protein n=1 Tax=Gordonia sp. MP11Mi TaxID=3022769 RepID=A0AA97CUC7_9ACTN
MTEQQKQAYQDVLTTKQVCASWPFLNENTMRYLRHAGTGPASFVVNKRVLYRRSEVERWLSEQEAATTRGGAA